jgi:UDP-2,4-diacetamido-2,4,6-trideoxy-beta-L-altropyranose hydrolase
LAQALHRKGERCVMVGPSLAYAKEIDSEVFTKWVSVSKWTSEDDDSSLFINLAVKYAAEWVVLDDYRINESYQLALRSAGLRWLQFDGTAQKPLWADLIINSNPSARTADYKGVIHNTDARLLLGPTYALLRPEFKNLTLREHGRPLKQVLVTFGGGDDHGANLFVLSSLLINTSSDLHFAVLSGQANPSNPRLKIWINANAHGRATLHIEPSQVVSLFLSSDLAIMAGGSSTHEAAACALPMILISIANNQVAQSKGWEELGAAIYLGPIESVKPASLSKAFRHVNADRSKRYNMAIASSRAAAAQGADRVADLMLIN